jgi:hypothetical protein
MPFRLLTGTDILPAQHRHSQPISAARISVTTISVSTRPSRRRSVDHGHCTVMFHEALTQ